MDKRKSPDTTTLAGALVGAHAATVQAAQADAMVSGMEAMQRAAERLGAKGDHFRRGDLFEYIEVAKFNADATRSSPARAHLTRDHGAPAAPADVVISRGTQVRDVVQIKASRDPDSLVDALRAPKYEGMQKVVPADQVEAVRRRAEQLSRRAAERGDAELARQHADTARNVTAGVHHGRASSGGTTNDELDFANRYPKLYRLRQETRYVAREVGRATATAALSGAVFSAAVSTVAQGYAVARGKQRLVDAAVHVGREAISGGARSGANAAVGAAVRYGAVRAGVRAVARGNIATTIASATIDTGSAVLRYARGEASAAETAEAIGQTGASTFSSVYAGAAAGAVFGPVGAIVGAAVGSLVAANVYQSCVAVLKDAELSRAEAERVEALCEESIAAWAALREEVDVRTAEFVGQRETAIVEALARIDAGLDDPTGASAIEGFTMFAESFGVSLQLLEFDDFDEFMLNSDEPLRF